MRIALVSKLDDPDKQAAVRAACPGAKLLEVWSDRDALARDGHDVQVVFGNVREQEFDALPNLRWVHATWTGVENLLYEKMVHSDVIVTNTRGQVAEPMAEHALAAVMYLARDLPAFVSCSRRGRWQPADYDPRLLTDSTVLVMGTGAIAAALIPRLVALGVEVIGVNTSGRGVDGCAACYTLDTVRPVLGRVDFVIVLMPLTPATRGSIDRGFLSRLAPGAGLVNVARGPIIEQDAMIDLIDAGRLRGAVLDVTTPEPPPGDSRLFHHDRILLTGHRSWQPSPGDDRALEVFCDNLRCLAEGRVDAMCNRVNKAAGY
jgi:phosphoglycerate dehydrogenase-like enzyme